MFLARVIASCVSSAIISVLATEVVSAVQNPPSDTYVRVADSGSVTESATRSTHEKRGMTHRTGDGQTPVPQSSTSGASGGPGQSGSSQGSTRATPSTAGSERAGQIGSGGAQSSGMPASDGGANRVTRPDAIQNHSPSGAAGDAVGTGPGPARGR